MIKNYLNTIGFVFLIITMLGSPSLAYSIEELRRDTGIKAMWEMGFKGEGVHIMVHDSFTRDEDEPEKLTHGEKVANIVRALAPAATVYEIDRSETPWDAVSRLKIPTNRLIVNLSHGRKKRERFTWRADVVQELVEKHHKLGAVFVKTAGNHNEIMGANPYTKNLVELARAVNEDGNGYMVLAGQAATKFSRFETGVNLDLPRKDFTKAGIGREYYIYVKNANLVLQTRDEKRDEAAKSEDSSDEDWPVWLPPKPEPKVQEGIGFEKSSGTSFAAPVISSALALLMEARPDLSGREAARQMLRNAVKSTHRQLPYTIRNEVAQATFTKPSQWQDLLPIDIFGQGRLDIYRAYLNENEIQRPLSTENDDKISGVLVDAFDMAVQGVYIDVFMHPKDISYPKTMRGIFRGATLRLKNGFKVNETIEKLNELSKNAFKDRKRREEGMAHLLTLWIITEGKDTSYLEEIVNKTFEFGEEAGFTFSGIVPFRGALLEINKVIDTMHQKDEWRDRIKEFTIEALDKISSDSNKGYVKLIKTYLDKLLVALVAGGK